MRGGLRHARNVQNRDVLAQRHSSTTQVEDVNRHGVRAGQLPGVGETQGIVLKDLRVIPGGPDAHTGISIRVRGSDRDCHGSASRNCQWGVPGGGGSDVGLVSSPDHRDIHVFIGKATARSKVGDEEIPSSIMKRLIGWEVRVVEGPPGLVIAQERGIGVSLVVNLQALLQPVVLAGTAELVEELGAVLKPDPLAGLSLAIHANAALPARADVLLIDVIKAIHVDPVTGMIKSRVVGDPVGHVGLPRLGGHAGPLHERVGIALLANPGNSDRIADGVSPDPVIRVIKSQVVTHFMLRGAQRLHPEAPASLGGQAPPAEVGSGEEDPHMAVGPRDGGEATPVYRLFRGRGQGSRRFIPSRIVGHGVNPGRDGNNEVVLSVRILVKIALHRLQLVGHRIETVS